MADAFLLAKSPVETLKEFNSRLQEYCEDEDVTRVHLGVTGGQPFVVLYSDFDLETYPATEKEIKAGLAQPGDRIPKLATEEDVQAGISDEVGDPIINITGPRLSCGVILLDQSSHKEAAATEKRAAKLYDAADRDLAGTLEATGVKTVPLMISPASKRDVQEGKASVEGELIFKDVPPSAFRKDTPVVGAVPVQVPVTYQLAIWPYIEDLEGDDEIPDEDDEDQNQDLDEDPDEDVEGASDEEVDTPAPDPKPKPKKKGSKKGEE
jgi:hypothetical protein